MRLLGYFDAYLGFLSAQRQSVKNVLDVGCGTGAFAEAHAVVQPGAAMALLEPSASMLDRAKHALIARGVEANPIQARLEDFNSDTLFDGVLAAHVLEHCSDPVAALRKMRALVEPGATLWLVVSKPHWCNAIIWLQWRHRTYRPHEVQKMLNKSGWRLDDQQGFPVGPPSRTSRGYRATAV